MTTLKRWPDPEHDQSCCVREPWDFPDPRCPGAVVAEKEAA